MTTAFRGVKFTKMHGAGNDYVYIDCTNEMPPIKFDVLARCISNRHYGIGSDGLVVIMKSDIADFKMRMFNADGSEAQMCGNASRCIGKFVFDKGLTVKTHISLETLAGVKYLYLHVIDGVVNKVTVDMGEPILIASKIPVNCPNETIVSMPIELDDIHYSVTAVSMGNPHGVIFVEEITDNLVKNVGKKLETHSMWPQKANIEFAKIISPGKIEMRVWERGSGETMACGTGACATVVAAVLNHYTHREVCVALRGGELKIHWDMKTNHVFMTGDANSIADGIFYIDLMNELKVASYDKDK